MNTVATMITRQDYMNGKATHREYYAQFVTASTRAQIAQSIGTKRLIASTDEHFNDIPLALWDRVAPPCPARMRDHGDFPTLAGQVCIAKEAARQIVEAAQAVQS